MIHDELAARVLQLYQVEKLSISAGAVAGRTVGAAVGAAVTEGACTGIGATVGTAVGSVAGAKTGGEVANATADEYYEWKFSELDRMVADFVYAQYGVD